MNQLTDNIKR